MCKNIDGATSAILLIAESLIEYSLHSNDVNAIAEQYPRLNDYKDSAIIKGIGPKIRVETSILILTGMKEELKERVDLM